MRDGKQKNKKNEKKKNEQEEIFDHFCFLLYVIPSFASVQRK